MVYYIVCYDALCTRWLRRGRQAFRTVADKADSTEIVFPMSNYHGETPLQALTKQVVEPQNSCHGQARSWSPLCPAGARIREKERQIMWKLPFPVSFPVSSAAQSIVSSSDICGHWRLRDFCGAGRLPNAGFSVGWTSPLFSSEWQWGIRVQTSPLRSLRAWVD